jgi:hypothetical protein
MQLSAYYYCYFCHTTTLVGGTPRHKPGCEVLRIIQEACATAKKEVEKKEADAPAD